MQITKGVWSNWLRNDIIYRKPIRFELFLQYHVGEKHETRRVKEMGEIFRKQRFGFSNETTIEQHKNFAKKKQQQRSKEHLFLAKCKCKWKTYGCHFFSFSTTCFRVWRLTDSDKCPGCTQDKPFSCFFSCSPGVV